MDTVTLFVIRHSYRTLECETNKTKTCDLCDHIETKLTSKLAKSAKPPAAVALPPPNPCDGGSGRVGVGPWSNGTHVNVKFNRASTDSADTYHGRSRRRRPWRRLLGLLRRQRRTGRLGTGRPTAGRFAVRGRTDDLTSGCGRVQDRKWIAAKVVFVGLDKAIKYTFSLCHQDVLRCSVIRSTYVRGYCLVAGGLVTEWIGRRRCTGGAAAAVERIVVPRLLTAEGTAE